jgi:hypothetical protein
MKIRQITCKDGQVYAIGKTLDLAKTVGGGIITGIDSDSGLFRVTTSVKTLDRSWGYAMMIPENDVQLVAFYPIGGEK